ncbi:MAG: Na/Pi cotransporter family protein [Syntrophales bacterium]|jgi:phosphate:Na+ symporter|nr:Na/Pi cotransporter family protein [Syntrophales bacterium]MCK9528700.1 Na/Pi cotransporter family protein [Syntrophales bacterium]MDX9922653.1 Na/Pi cotransporter family protein [Syntrophales bacterium]
MDIHALLGVTGGLGLLVFAMYVLSSSLNKLTHETVRAMLENLAGKWTRSALAGVTAAALTQSSTSTSVTATGFLNAGIIHLVPALAVMIGAGVGTTMTAHIIAFNLAGIAPFFIFVGALLHFIAPKSTHQNRGLALFGFGALFLSISMISSDMAILGETPAIRSIFLFLESRPLAALPAGLLITLLLRNSSTSMGLIIAISLAGLLDLRGALFLVFGINVGASVNVIIAAIGSSPASKQLALGNILFTAVGLAAALLMIPLYLALLPQVSGSLPRQIALGHTVFNVVIALLALPFMSFFESCLKRILPEKDEKAQEIRYLSQNFLSTPYLALMAVIREITVMLSICRSMLEKAEACVVEYNHKLMNELVFEEESVDEMQKNLTAYLVDITRNELTVRQQRSIPALLHSVNDLEKVADYCEDIAILAQQAFEEDLFFSENAQRELKRLFGKTKTMMNLTADAIIDNDREAARATLGLMDEIDEAIERYKINHVTRLESGICTSEPGIIFSDILTDIERMNNHLLNITKGVLHIGKR